MFKLPSPILTNIFYQFGILGQRAFRNFFRNKFLLVIRLIQTVVFGIILGLLYLQIANDQSTISDRAGALFFILTNQAFGSVFGVINAFPQERAVFIKERNSGTYRVSPYYFTKGNLDCSKKKQFGVYLFINCIQTNECFF